MGVKGSRYMASIHRFFIPLFWVFLPNLLLGTVASFLAVERPWVNVDYAALLFLSLWLPRTVLAGGFFVLLIFDLLALIGQIFPVVSLSDFFYLFSFIGVAPGIFKVSASISILILLFVVWGFYLSVSKITSRELLIVVNLVFLPFAVQAFSYVDVDRGSYRFGRSYVFDSQLDYSFHRWLDYTNRFGVKGEVSGIEESHSISEPLFDISRVQSKKVLLVVSESWGDPKASVQEALLAPLFKRAQKFVSFEWGSLGFQGITVQAEIRELCNVHLAGARVKSAYDDLPVCLPELYRDKGFYAVAMHGAVGTMYERSYWYPEIGFEETIFFESREWPRRCYSFPGACDVDMMKEIPAIMAEHEKVFFYWLTLNSHYKYDTRDIDKNRLDCSMYGIDEKTQSCRNFNLHAQFFAELAKLVDDPAMSGVKVIVVGDHSPLISNKDEKELYFQQGKVAWLEFTIK